jgi:PhoPQ-activated pathogenicity-related protein
MKKHLALLALLALLVPTLGFAREAAPEVPQKLAEYLAAADEAAKWELVGHQKIGTCDFWQLSFTSQEWQGFRWEHDLLIFRPADVPTDGKVLLLNDGGRFRAERAIYGATLANLVKAPVAVLLGVPMQPLFGNKTEDHLIAETFIRYLETEDGSWPLLFPMVKSVVRSMDAIQEFSAAHWDKPAEAFIVGGASKRGWTAWLTTASDPRVSAVVPMVIDLLNIPQQVPLQISRFGEPSESIKPYTERDLVPLQDTPQARNLWKMVDPWSYRSQLSMPKMVVLANNDPYWTTDALNLYWDDLPGDKYISYSPNAGHNLVEIGPDGVPGLPLRAFNSIAAFVRCHITGKPMPKLTWRHEDAEDGSYRIRITADPAPAEAHLWIATSPNQDFRGARWEKSAPLETGEGEITGLVAKPPDGYVAFYADLGYQIDELPLRLCTQLRLGGGRADE